MTNTGIPTPNSRRLRGYSFDPSLSVQLDTALVNEAVFKIRWEEPLKQGPVGEYLEVVDFDPASNCFYEPIDLNDPYILAQDGLQPSESNPQFHQQMAYAVAMTTIENFENALGRKALWSPYRSEKSQKDGTAPTGRKKVLVENFVQRLRIYPHALRQANAYYSPMKKALMFGYFPASSDAPGDHIPKGMVFTCLSHDIVAHETTHALLDGMHRRFIEDSHPDTLAFHEAFADIVALFQHFSFPEVLRQQIAKTRGDLASQSLLGQLAQQFGKAIGQYGALRDAIGEFDKKENKWKPRQPDPNDYQREMEPHSRGAILVAAVFEAFLSIYKCRIADLLRIASNGTGILTPGELHPDLVNRLAREAAKTAQQVLNMCIRGLDYCPPVDINFGDYLRAIITADTDLVPEDDMGYRIAFIESFRRRGIYPRDIRTLSESSLSWTNIREEEQQGIFKVITARTRFFVQLLTYLDEIPDVERVPEVSPQYKAYLKDLMMPDLKNKWSSLDAELKTKRWKELFENYPLPLTPWDQLSDFDKRHAEKLLWSVMSDRQKIFRITRAAQAALHEWLADYKADANSEDVERFEELTGLYLVKTPAKELKVSGLKSGKGKFNLTDKYTFECHSFRAAQRVGPLGKTVSEVIISLTQKRRVPLIEGTPTFTDDEAFDFRGGCTLILDLHTLKLKYVVKKLIDDSDGRLTRQREYRTGESGASLRATYFGRPSQTGNNEPFALLHGD